jgi:hypothetical protein
VSRERATIAEADCTRIALRLSVIGSAHLLVSVVWFRADLPNTIELRIFMVSGQETVRLLVRSAIFRQCEYPPLHVLAILFARFKSL